MGDPETFFDELPAVMKQVPPLPGEESLYKWIGPLRGMGSLHGGTGFCVS